RAGSIRVDGIKLTIKRREFDRYVDAGQWSLVVLVNQLVGRPAVDLLSQAGEQVQVSLLILLDLQFRDDGLAEQVDGKGQVAAAHGTDDPEDPGQVRGRNKTARQALRVGAGGPGQQSSRKAVTREPAQPQPHPAGQIGAGLFKVLAQVPGDFFRGLQ